MAGTISKGGLLLLVAMALFAVLDVASACASTCVKYRRDGSCEYRRYYRMHRFGGRRRFGRQIADDEHDSNYYRYDMDPQEFSTTCREAICTDVSGLSYRTERINDAVDLVRRIMASSHPDMAERRKEIDPEVLNFHSRPQQQVSNEDLAANVDGCSVRANVKLPREGISTEDEGHYFIVNIPSLRQPVQFIECLGGKSKTCEVEGGDSTCQQAYREEQLLALPADVRTYYGPSDFKIKKFRIPNGCQCGEGIDLVVNLD